MRTERLREVTPCPARVTRALSARAHFGVGCQVFVRRKLEKGVAEHSSAQSGDVRCVLRRERESFAHDLEALELRLPGLQHLRSHGAVVTTPPEQRSSEVPDVRNQAQP